MDFFIWIGLAVMLVPARIFVKMDRGTGYHIYKSAPNEASGLRRASIFYKLFGLVFVAIGLQSNPRWLNELELFLAKF